MIHPLLRLAPAVPLALAAAPALAQDAAPVDKVNQVTVYDQADCPAEQPGTITSCIVITGESPYRIPNALRTVPDTPPNRSPAVNARKTITPVSGFGSCSASGVASQATCSGQEYEDWKKRQGQGRATVYADLIEKERRERLGLIDQEAADQQAIADADTAAADGATTVVEQPADPAITGTTTPLPPDATADPATPPQR